jgi:tetratricopeptide (TPR) repeat protein
MRSRFAAVIAVGSLLSIVPIAAQAQTDTALKLSSSNAKAVAEFRAGMSDYQSLSVEAASAHYKNAVDADPNFGLARVMYGAANFAPVSAQTTADLNRGVADAAMHGNANELILAAAYREATLGNQAAANALFKAAAQLMPKDHLVGFAAAGGFATSLATARDFVALNPDFPLGYNTVAYASWAAGDRTAALAAAKRQVELNPGAPNPHDTYAELLQWNGNFAEAATHYKHAAALPIKFPEAYTGLAEVEALQGHYDQARSYLNQAIANASTPAQKLGYMREIAGTYAMEGTSAASMLQSLEAVAAEAKAQNDVRVEAIAYSQIAAIQATGGQTAAAHQSLAKAEALGTGVPWSVHYYGAITHAIMKHWGPAGQELAALKAQAASDRTVSKDMLVAAEAHQLTQQGKPADALTMLMTADTTNVLVMNRIAEAHAALGHSAEATAWNNRINQDYALNLMDFTNVNSRRRARTEFVAKPQ